MQLNEERETYDTDSISATNILTAEDKIYSCENKKLVEQVSRVSLCVIALNEEQNLGQLFENILDQDYEHSLIEIVLVDSGSIDNTKNMMLKFAEDEKNDFAKITVLDNLGRIQSSGWNIAIANSTGDVIIRVDAHALIPEDFVKENVNCINSGEYVCGGRRINIIDGENFGKKVLLMAENSMFGSGVATYRNSDKKQYVKTVAHACYRKEVFEKVGVFNESLKRSEDNELHYRIRQCGYRICMSDKIHSQYQTRATFKGMLRQKWGNGKWIGITSVVKTPKVFSLYHFVPLLFVTAAIVCAILFGLAFIPSMPWWLGIPFVAGVAIYFIVDILLTLKSCIDYKEWRGVFVLPIMFPLLHFSYGLGTLQGFFASPWYLRRKT